jgi:hypothetical protein
MKYRATQKGRELTNRLSRENPYQIYTQEYGEWAPWALKAVCGDPPPTQDDIPAAHEGYQWGLDFNAQWQLVRE